VASVDKRLIPCPTPDEAWMNRNGLNWYQVGHNTDYLASQCLELSAFEMREMLSTSDNLYGRLMEAARWVAENNLWEKVGVPSAAIPLLGYSIRQEADLHLLGRFDYAGGMDGLPLKLLEFNADTCSLLPETILMQPEMARRIQGTELPASWQLYKQLVRQFRQLLEQHRDKEPTLLLSSLGYEEDVLNLEIVRKAALEAGFQIAQQVDLPNVIFSADEGIFVELRPDEFQRYDFWFKMVPWDFICHEEPDLLDLLTSIITGGHALVINPAFTMLLQSKALLVYLYENNPMHPAVLPASFTKAAFEQKSAYVEKPIIGRMGENIAIYDQHAQLLFENDGDYGDFPTIFQEKADINFDQRGRGYQPGVFWVQGACGIGIRRQEGLLLDDDAQFVTHTVVDRT
jgi:glutathionylspermidine synthase